MTEFVRVRIPETGAEWFCHPMTAEAHGLKPFDDEPAETVEIADPQQDSVPAE